MGDKPGKEQNFSWEKYEKKTKVGCWPKNSGFVLNEDILIYSFYYFIFSGHPWAQEKFPKRGDSSGGDISWFGYTCKSAPGWLCHLGQTALPLWVQQQRCCLNAPLDIVVCGFVSLTRYAFWAGEDKGRRKGYPGRQGLCLERKQGAQGKRKTEDQRVAGCPSSATCQFWLLLKMPSGNLSPFQDTHYNGPRRTAVLRLALWGTCAQRCPWSRNTSTRAHSQPGHSCLLLGLWDALGVTVLWGALGTSLGYQPQEPRMEAGGGGYRCGTAQTEQEGSQALPRVSQSSAFHVSTRSPPENPLERRIPWVEKVWKITALSQFSQCKSKMKMHPLPRKTA